MLTAQLTKDIDNRWEACWPASSLKPLVLIDCISYLLFYKRLEDYGLITSTNCQPSKQKLYFVNDCDELSWDKISTLNAKELHILFSKANGVTDLLKNYGHTNLPYSQFLKTPLLVNPSSVLLANAVEIIKIIESENDSVKGEVFEYLLHKKGINTTSGPAYCPEEITDTLISLIHPNGEVICDPSCGNGELLVSVLSYFSKKDKKLTPAQLSKKLTGMDDDPVQLRIAAMNLILHGLEKPQVSNINTKKNAELFSRKKPVLLISNLYFKSAENTQAVTSATTNGNGKKDIAILNAILDNLNEGSRAAVIVGNYLLSNNILSGARLIRQRLVDNYKIDAIINIPDKAGSFFSGSSLFIFHSDANSVSDKVCFYKMNPKPYVNSADMVEFGSEIQNAASNANTETIATPTFDDIPIQKNPILSEGLFVSTEEIKNNNYNLDASRYREKIFEPSLTEVVKKLIVENESMNSISMPGQSKLTLAKEKLKIFVRSLNIQATTMALARQLKAIRLKKLSAGKLENLNIKKNYLTNSITLKKALLQETLTTISVCILALTFCITALFFKNRPKSPNPPSLEKNSAFPGISTVKSINTKTGQKKQLTPQQIKAILKDTTGVIHVEDFTSGSDDNALDSQINAAVKNE